MTRRSKYRDESKLLGIVTAVVSVGALYFGRVVFIPFALALLFSILLAPSVAFLEKTKLPRIVAILLIVLTLMGVTGAVGWISSEQIGDLTGALPGYKKTLEEKIRAVRTIQGSSLTNVFSTVRELGAEIAQAVPGSSPFLAKKPSRSSLGSSAAQPMSVAVVPTSNPLSSVESIFGPVATGAAVAVFTIFILMGREDLRNRLIKLVGGTRLNVVTRALDDATHRINRYLLLQLIVNGSYGAIIGAALYFTGIPNAALWGVSAGILRFLPYVGAPLAAVMPIILSLAVFNGWWHAFATAGMYLVLELVVANVVEPLLYGSHVGLSPLAILVAAVFWTLIWGFPGLILSTPLTVCLVVVGRHSSSFAFLNVLLGDEPVLTPQAQYYQRLLAGDQAEASQVLAQWLKEHSLEDTYSSVLLPALSLAEQDRHRNELDEDTQTFLYQTTRELIEELGSEENEQSEQVSRLNILGIPARDEGDEMVALMLCQLLERDGFHAKSMSVAALSAVLPEVAAVAPDIVCISALPPFAVAHTKALYRRLRKEFPKLEVMIGFWHFEGDMEKIGSQFRLESSDHLMTTLPQVLEYLRQRGAKVTHPQSANDASPPAG